jgi:hypothetical protein
VGLVGETVKATYYRPSFYSNIKLAPHAREEETVYNMDLQQHIREEGTNNLYEENV